MKIKYKKYEIIEDLEIDFNRKGLRKIIDLSIEKWGKSINL